MAINVQKFLPSAKTTSIVKVDSGIKLSSGLVKKKNISADKLALISQKSNNESVDIVRRSLIDVDSLLKSVLTEDRKTEYTKNIRKEQEKSEERETKLETPKESKKFNLPKVSLPGMSFLDKIKRFLFFTGLGWLFTRFQEQLPKLTAIVKIITPIYGVVENIFKFILESVVNFIDRGYQTYDKIRSIVKSVGGEKAQQDFDKLSSKLNEYINYVLVGGMALTGAITTFTKNAKNYKPPQPQVNRPPVTGGRPGVTTSGGRPVGKPDIRSPLRQRPRITTSGGKSVQQNIAKNILRKTVKPTLSRLPLLGGLVEFGLSWALGDPVGKAAFRGVGTLLLGAVGSLIMPGFGTFAGGWLGAELAGKLYDVLFQNKKPTASVQTQKSGGRIKRYTKGGQVLGSGGRTLTIQKRKKPYIQPQTTQPGKDVGGKNKIRELYPDPSKKLSVSEWNLAGGVGTYADYEKEYEKRKNKPNAYKALTEVAEILKDIPFGIGSLMGGAVDVALGQKISRSTLSSINYGLENLFRTISEKSAQGLYGVQKQISTMQGGGSIPRTSGIGSVEVDPLKIIGVSIKQKVDEALRKVQKQISVGNKKLTPSPLFTYTPPTPRYTGSWKPASPGYFNAIQYITGDKNYPSNYDYDGHGTPYNYHDHIAFATPKDKENAKKALLAAGIVTGSEFRPGDPGYHGSNQAIDVPGGQWGGAPGSPITQAQYNGSAKVRSVLGIDKVQQPKTQPGQLPPIFQLPGQKPKPSSGVFLTGVHKKAADIIAGYESSSSGGYNAMNRGTGGDSPEGPKKYFGRNLTDMTIAEVIALQAKGRTTLNAAGRYQFVGNTLPSAMRVAGLSPSDKFSSLSQDKMFAAYLRKNGHKPWTGPWGLGKYSKEELKILDEAVKTPIPPYQGGGYIPKQVPKKDVSKLKTYTSYSGSGTRVAIQPVIIEKVVPVPTPSGGNRSVTFPVPVGVNNNMQSLSRG